MNLRKWAIVAGLLMMALGSAVYELKHYLEQKKRLEYLMVQAVSPYIKGSFQVGRVRLGFFSAHLNEVRIRLPAQALAITVDDIRVNISIFRLFFSGFSVARSIGKIVLISPTIEISLAKPAGSDSLRSDIPRIVEPSSPVHVSHQFGLEYLFVKNGVIRLKDRRGQIAVLGEQLQGRMWDNGSELNYKLTGKLGASKRNLFVNGRISWRGEKHRLSLKLDKAEIRHPLVFKDVMISGGALTGALEFLFPDTVSFGNIESNGWIRIDHGTCRMGISKKTYNSVNLSLSVSGTRITIDSLSLRHSGARFHANGAWDLAGKDSSDRIDFESRDLWLDSLGLQSVRNACRVVGAGWVKGTLERKKDADAELSVICGGVTLWGKPLLRMSSHVKFQRKQVEFDSLSLYSPACAIAGKGIVDYSREPVVYGFQVSGTFDSLAFIQPQSNGKLRFSGILNGVGKDRNGQFSLQGRNIGYAGIPMGGVVIMTAQVKGDSATFLIRNEEHGNIIKAGGVLSRLFTDHTQAACTLSVKVRQKSHLFSGRLAQYPRPDSIKINAFFNGWIDTFYLKLTADAYGRKVKGGVTLECCRSSSRGRDPAVWKLEQRNLVVGGIPSECNGTGKWYRDSLTVDSLVLLDRAIFAGKVAFTTPCRIDAGGTFNIPLKNLLGLTAKGVDAVESGRVYGVMRFSGSLDKIDSRAELHMSDVKIGGIGMLQMDANVTGSGCAFTVLPVVLRKDGLAIATVDTITNMPHLHLSGKFENMDLRAVLGTLLPEETTVEGQVTGLFHSSENGFPITVSITSTKVMYNGWQFDSIKVNAAFDSMGIRIRSLHACDGPRTAIAATGFVPMSLLRGDENDRDTLQADVSVKGDLIATLHQNVSDVIDGSGQGSLTMSINGQPENWHVREGSLFIPKATLLLKPYLRDPIADFSCSMTINDMSSVTTEIRGIAGKRSMHIFSTHEIPLGYVPIKAGPLNFGVLQIETPQHGLDIHLPGFMEKGETGDLEPTAKSPFRYFSLAGPINNLTVVGILLLRDLEFTYPLLEDRESPGSPARRSYSSSNPSITSLIKWDMDIKPADRKVMYFRDISGNNTRLVRFFEAYIDQGTSVLHLLGSDNDNTLKISGLIKSYHGAVYYGKTFDRNLEAGLEFVPQKKANAPGYDNRPILWGSAEAYSDTSRFDRIKLTALVQDPKSGTLSERGRLVKGRLNVVFHLSSGFEELPGESEREFYRQAGLQFTTLGSAGKFMSDFGEQNLNRILLQRFERKLAKTIGLDVISIETSIASNYFTRFYTRQFENQAMQMQADYLALANAGITVGRYFFRDNLLIKASGGLLPLDTSLTPQYSFGLEFQPTRYLFMDFDYGFYKKELAIEHNPRVNLQLRLPISGLRNLFDF